MTGKMSFTKCIGQIGIPFLFRYLLEVMTLIEMKKYFKPLFPS